MRLAPALALAFACASGGSVAADPPGPKELPAAERPLQARINAAIDRGVAHLRASQRKDGSWAGEFGSAGATGLALFTLRCSGVPKDDPAAVAAARYLGGLGVAAGTVQDVMRDEPRAVRMTYDHALLVLALVAHDPVAHRMSIRRSVEVLVAAQQRSGSWAYLVTMGGPLDHGDNSNTQFALLALRHAALAGFTVPRAVWQRAYHHFESTAAKDGGWGYGCPGTMEGTYGSMTAVGVASLVICKAMLVGEAQAPTVPYLKTPAIAAGVRWIVERFAVDRNPAIADVSMSAPGGGPPMPAPGGLPAMPAPSGRTFHFYWLYALERVGMLLGLPAFGRHDWYREGAAWLLAAQANDGGWSNPDGSAGAPEPPLAATCFALLFLRRATPPVVTVTDDDR